MKIITSLESVLKVSRVSVYITQFFNEILCMLKVVDVGMTIIYIRIFIDGKRIM